MLSTTNLLQRNATDEGGSGTPAPVQVAQPAKKKYPDLPPVLTIGGNTFAVESTPELKAFVETVSKHASGVTKEQLYPQVLSRSIASPAHQRARIEGSTSKFRIAARAFSGR